MQQFSKGTAASSILTLLDIVTDTLHPMPGNNDWVRHHAAPAAAVLTSCRDTLQASR